MRLDGIPALDSWDVIVLVLGNTTQTHDRTVKPVVCRDTHVNINSIVMWVTLLNNAGWDFFKTPILREILRTQNLLQVEHCAFLEVIHLFQ